MNNLSNDQNEKNYYGITLVCIQKAKKMSKNLSELSGREGLENNLFDNLWDANPKGVNTLFKR